MKITCKNCGSSRIKKNGHKTMRDKTITQSYKCQQCGKQFQDSTKNTKTRILAISDFHCGHNYGLTPPEWQVTKGELRDFHRESWLWFMNAINLLKPFNIAIINGDLIDGRQERSGGSELLCGVVDQIRMASEIIDFIGADKNYITRGTPYHVGQSEQFEDLIADKTDSHIDNSINLEVNGCRINARHKIGGSTIPHGRFTALAKEGMWQDLAVAGTDTPKTNIIIRSHVHYTSHLGNGNNRLIFTTPALQGHSDYGTKMCTGIVDYGFTIIDVEADGTFTFKPILANLDSLKTKWIDG